MQGHRENQAFGDSDSGPAIERMLDRQFPALSGWYGDPISREVAQQLVPRAREELRTRLCAGGACFQLHLLLLACHFWTGQRVDLEYEQLAASTGEGRERALLELVYGQLLISCKVQDAAEHLTRGFSLAAGFLDAPDYFRLVRQHELFAYLPVSPSPSSPRRLESLLTEAGVIKRMQEGAGRRYNSTHRDTVG